MAETVLTAFWLLTASIMDIRTRRLPAWMLALGGAAAVMAAVCRCGFTTAEYLEIIKGCIPGAFLLFMAAVTGKAGMADGIALIFLGICLGGKICLAVFMLSLLIISLFSGILLALCRVGPGTRLPYLPFLSAAWLLGQAVLF